VTNFDKEIFQKLKNHFYLSEQNYYFSASSSSSRGSLLNANKIQIVLLRFYEHLKQFSKKKIFSIRAFSAYLKFKTNEKSSVTSRTIFLRPEVLFEEVEEQKSSIFFIAKTKLD